MCPSYGSIVTIAPFDLTLPGRVLFGRGRLREAGGVAREFGHTALVVTGRSGGRVAPLLELLTQSQVHAHVFSVAGEPTTAAVAQGADLARNQGAEMVIGLGGGSAVDTAKAVAALASNPGELTDYLEVIGQGAPLRNPPLPCLVIPTTAGTGAEATRNAVLSSTEHRVKVSLRSPLMLPRVAIVDPDLTDDLPSDLTATTGLDALTQLIEAFVSSRANPLTDSICRDGIARAARALPIAFEGASRDPATASADPRFLVAREEMALASLWSGIALANAGLGAVHGFAGPVGGRFDIPHGAICAALLPAVMSANIEALQARAPNDRALERYTEVARLMTGRAEATPRDGVEAVRRLCAQLNIRSLRALGMTPDAVRDVVAGARRASSMKGNPIVLMDDELTAILTHSGIPRGAGKVEVI